jgi:flagellar biogenesis protein FliO
MLLAGTLSTASAETDDDRRFGRIEPGSGPAVATDVKDDAWELTAPPKPVAAAQPAKPTATQPAAPAPAQAATTPATTPAKPPAAGADGTPPRSIAHLLKPGPQPAAASATPSSATPTTNLSVPGGPSEGEIARTILEEELAAAQAAVAARAGQPDAATDAGPSRLIAGADRPLGASDDARPLGTARGGGTLDAIGGLRGLARTGAALAVVLGLIYGLLWVVRRLQRGASIGSVPGMAGRAPSGILEVLGRYPIGPRQALVVMKFDRRVLLLSQTTGKQQTEMTTLCELTDPEDVASVLLKARDGAGETASRAFASAMHVAELEAGEAERRAVQRVYPQAEVEMKPAPAPAYTPAPAFSQPTNDTIVEPKPIGATRRYAEDTAVEAERAELWGEPIPHTADHPAQSLKRRLEALRQGRGA